MSKRILVLTLACMTAAGTLALYAQAEEAERVKKAAQAFGEIMSVPDKAIPQSILDKAEGIAVIPGMLKGGLGIGGHHGKGILSTRNREGNTWSNPAFLTVTGGSFGAQIGAEQVDLVLVVMNKAGIDNLLKNEFKIGGDASVAAGPVGRAAEASTDIALRAEILSYSRARGLFAGVTLNGSSIREDEEANQRFYGRAVRNADIVGAKAGAVGTAGKVAAPDAVSGWRQVLAKYAK